MTCAEPSMFTFYVALIWCMYVCALDWLCWRDRNSGNRLKLHKTLWQKIPNFDQKIYRPSFRSKLSNIFRTPIKVSFLVGNGKNYLSRCFKSDFYLWRQKWVIIFEILAIVKCLLRFRDWNLGYHGDIKLEENDEDIWNAYTQPEYTAKIS